MKTKIIQYSICFVSCLILAFLVAVLTGLFTPYEEFIANTSWNVSSEINKIYFALTNGTFVSGILAICIGLLIMATNYGAFEFIAYGMRRFISLFQKDVNKIKYKTYYDYHVAKSEQPKKSFLYFIIVGGFFLLLSGIFTYCWNITL